MAYCRHNSSNCGAAGIYVICADDPQATAGEMWKLSLCRVALVSGARTAGEMGALLLQSVASVPMGFVRSGDDIVGNICDIQRIYDCGKSGGRRGTGVVIWADVICLNALGTYL